MVACAAYSSRIQGVREVYHAPPLTQDPSKVVPKCAIGCLPWIVFCLKATSFELCRLETCLRCPKFFILQVFIHQQLLCLLEQYFGECWYNTWFLLEAMPLTLFSLFVCSKRRWFLKSSSFFGPGPVLVENQPILHLIWQHPQDNRWEQSKNTPPPSIPD